MSAEPAITEVPLSVELMRRHDLSREECIVYGAVVAFARINVRPTYRQLCEILVPAYERKTTRPHALRDARRRLSKLRALNLIAATTPQRRGIDASRFWPTGPR